jgi:NADH:ubiquinone oxidoreductase subunit 5 (subunit L)/multisubunit Na+/H+ antiporter MnhA subunit
MSHDPYLPRFLGYLSLFTFCMLFLVTASNFVQMFIGWEGVGLCSYLLINFWFTRIAANKAALKAMITNRISDVFLMFGIVLILITFKTSNYLIVFNLIPFIVTKTYIMFNVTISLVSVVAFFLFVGAIGKSAQIGFHV